jgi:hypothetical protein
MLWMHVIDQNCLNRSSLSVDMQHNVTCLTQKRKLHVQLLLLLNCACTEQHAVLQMQAVEQPDLASSSRLQS